jgi:hypothetical protein
MRSISQSCLLVAAVALAFCFSARLAYADGESVSGCAKCNGYSFTASITQVGTSGTTSTYQVIYTVTNNTGPASTPYNWSLTAFDNGDGVSNSTGLSVTGPDNGNGTNYTGDYGVAAGKTNNGNGSCNGTISSAFCVLQKSGAVGLPVLNTGQSLTFTFDINCDANCVLLSSWDFLGSSNPPGSTTGNVYAITNWGTPTSMPEPSVAFLYASTLAVGLVFAWRSRALRRPTKS